MAGQPRVMKQVLLRVASVLTEIRFRKLAQSPSRQLTRPRKISFPQDALDPDIYRKRAQAFVSEEHHTISNLCAYARQLAQRRAKIDIGKGVYFLKVDISVRDQPCGGEEVFRAITERALAQLSLRTLRDPLRRRKCVYDAVGDLSSHAKPLAQFSRDLPDVRHLLH